MVESVKRRLAAGRAPILLALVVALSVPHFAAGAGGGAGAGEAFERTMVRVVTAAGGQYRFRVELADTERRRAQGLQGRRDLAPDAGMLFDFGRPGPVAMWMKDTYVALDMIFIDGGGRIVGIAPDTVPLSLAVIESPGPVKGVLEVRAGTAARLGIRAGDTVEHAAFR